MSCVCVFHACLLYGEGAVLYNRKESDGGEGVVLYNRKVDRRVMVERCSCDCVLVQTLFQSYVFSVFTIVRQGFIFQSFQLEKKECVF